MFRCIRSYTLAATYQDHDNPMEAILLSIALDQEKRLDAVEGALRQVGVLHALAGMDLRSHALVDSLYVRRKGATRQDYIALAREITGRTRLPLAVEAVYRYVVFFPSRRFPGVPVPNRFFAVNQDGGVKVRGLELRRQDTAPLIARMQQRIIEVLAEAHDYDCYCRKLDEARQILWRYEESLENGTVTLDDLIVSKRLTRAPRDYGKAGHSAIAAQQLYGSGVRLRPGQSVEYIITNSESRIPNDRVRAYAQWDGWHGYDRKKYAAMLREAFEPFERVRFGGMGPHTQRNLLLFNLVFPDSGPP